jgi:ABC-2 type transport system ATP-binding protein
MIAAHRLIRWFGNIPAVDSIDFEIGRGEVVGFLGPNGAGKTTTIRIICGCLRPTSGEVLVDGLDVVRRRREAQRRIGYLPESAPLHGELRVVEYIGFRAGLLGLGGRLRRRAVERVIGRCWLADVRRRPVGHLSKGYRQRVGLAAALLGDPPVLILDEPTSGLDPAQIRQVRGLIRELAGEHTVLLSTHILGEVEATCDRIVMLAGGRVRAAGTIEQLRDSAASERRYVVEVDGASCERALRAIPGVRALEGAALDGHWRRYVLTTARDAADLREPIGRAVAAAGAAVRELRREAAGLEGLFVRLVEGVADADDPMRRAPGGGA